MSRIRKKKNLKPLDPKINSLINQKNKLLKEKKKIPENEKKILSIEETISNMEAKESRDLIMKNLVKNKKFTDNYLGKIYKN